MSDQQPLLAGVELGGTKCVCVVGTGPDDIREKAVIPTGSDPNATLARIDSLLRGWAAVHGAYAGVGIACFGPLDLAPTSSTYGHITATTKPGWSHSDVRGRLTAVCSAPVCFDTDVTGAALAEQRWGAARGLDDFAYVTVGTGVGVGLIVAGKPVVGCHHGELGHVRVVRERGDDWPGMCAFHGDCVEGLASGPAIAARAGMAAAEIGAHHAAWGLAAHALAQLLHIVVLATAPRRILMGGGVIDARPELLVESRRRLRASLNGYLDIEALAGDLDHYVAPPGLGTWAGPLGALALAANAAALTG